MSDHRQLAGAQSAAKPCADRACTRIEKLGAERGRPFINPLSPEIRRQLYADRKSFTPAQERAILKAAAQKSHEINALCQVLYVTGCRLSEALNLRLNCIDTDADLLVFHTLKQRRATRLRAVPVPQTVIEMLLALSDTPDQRLWTFSRWTARRKLAEVFEAAAISGPLANSRTFRHSFNDRGKLAGVPDQVRCALLGHQSAQTNALYGRLLTPDLQGQAKACWGVLRV